VDDEVWPFSRGLVRKEGVRDRHIEHGLEVFEAQFCIYSLFTIPFLFNIFYLEILTMRFISITHYQPDPQTHVKWTELWHGRQDTS
jgi:hypothetical protein